MALRWTSKHKSFFLNGGWTIQRCGNYTINGNTFSYTSSDVFKKEKTGDQIQFFTQLSRSLEVYLIVQSINTGVRITYQLPQQSNEEEIKSNLKNSVTEKVSTIQPVSAEVNAYQKDNEFRDIPAAESVSSNKKRTSPVALSMIDDSSLKVNKQTWNQFDSTSQDTSRPKWVNELKDIMNLWQKDLADLKGSLLENTNRINDKLKSLEGRASQIETNIDTMVENMAENTEKTDARLTTIDSSIKTVDRKMNRIDSSFAGTWALGVFITLSKDH